jgi:AhpD family alkylhydroperoxidase
MNDVRQILADFQNGVAGIQEANGAFVDSFLKVQEVTFADGALSTKQKELISVAIGALNRCQYCIVVHVYQAYEAGATRDEILEAAMVAIGGFGAGPSMAYSATVLLDAVNEFENDFK